MPLVHISAFVSILLVHIRAGSTPVPRSFHHGGEDIVRVAHRPLCYPGKKDCGVCGPDIQLLPGSKGMFKRDDAMFIRDFVL